MCFHTQAEAQALNEQAAALDAENAELAEQQETCDNLSSACDCLISKFGILSEISNNLIVNSTAVGKSDLDSMSTNLGERKRELTETSKSIKAQIESNEAEASSLRSQAAALAATDCWMCQYDESWNW